MNKSVRHVMSLADLSNIEIIKLVNQGHKLRSLSKRALQPTPYSIRTKQWSTETPEDTILKHQSLRASTIALLFSKRSTRTRVAAETATRLLGGQALFLGKDDIQLGVNESAQDTSRVLSSMVQGIFARVGAHSEIEELARYSRVPVINALSDLWHPTQVLADLMTLGMIPQFKTVVNERTDHSVLKGSVRPLTVAYVGDSANVLHDMLVTYPRLGHALRVATPPKYRAPTAVWDKVVELECDKGITWVEDPREAVKDADLVITDTWISMGQEAEKEQRLKDFQGYQVTEALCREGGANPDWKFMHCLPRKEHEVDDEVFYGDRSCVFLEAENRKWSMMALFDSLFGHGVLWGEGKPKEDTERIRSAKWNHHESASKI